MVDVVNCVVLLRRKIRTITDHSSRDEIAGTSGSDTLRFIGVLC